jgi:hypothetical protein
MRATATGALQFVADPAETSTDPDQQGRTDILATDSNIDADANPDVIPDTRVFLVPTNPLTITAGAGEGEYTNAANNLDVNSDGHVTALDALIVINELNVNGPRDLRQLWTPENGPLPTNFIDVNLDGYTSPLDALNVINWLNANPIQPSSEGEGEGEAAGEADGSLVVCPPADTASMAAEGEDDGSAALLLASSTPTAAATTASTSSDDEIVPPSYSGFDSTVVDLLFAEDEEEIVTGSNSSSDDDAAGASDDLFATL